MSKGLIFVMTCALWYIRFLYRVSKIIVPVVANRLRTIQYLSVYSRLQNQDYRKSIIILRMTKIPAFWFWTWVKRFTQVTIKTLLTRLKNMCFGSGVTVTALDWFRQCLIGRSQKIKLTMKMLRLTLFDFSVFQGAVLALSSSPFIHPHWETSSNHFNQSTIVT